MSRFAWASEAACRSSSSPEATTIVQIRKRSLHVVATVGVQIIELPSSHTRWPGSTPVSDARTTRG